jgi:hypothetical protein
MVGQTVNFEVGLREVNVVIDGFMFIQQSRVRHTNEIRRGELRKPLFLKGIVRWAVQLFAF